MRPLLLSAVKALAAAPDEQRAIIGEGTVDDLALDLDGQPWHDEPANTRAALDQLSALLDTMSGSHHAQLWTADALEGHEWHQVRALARAALARPRS